MTTRYPFALIKESIAARRDEILDFAIGRLRLGLPDRIDAWIVANGKSVMQPAGQAETKEFTEAAAALLQREYGVNIAPSCILPTPGGRAAMSAFVACALWPGDRVLVTEPGYPVFARLADHRRATIHPIALNPDNGFAPDFAAASNDELSPVSVIALNYPNNPTGATLSSETISLLKDAVENATIVFNDATYGPLVYGRRPTSLLSVGFDTPKIELVELHSFSKLFPIGPLAVSFLAGSEQIMRSISIYSEFAWSPLSTLQMRTTTLCLRDWDRLDELRRFFGIQLDNLNRTLRHIGFEPYSSPSGVYSICRIPAHIGGNAVHTAAEATERLMREFDLAVVGWDTRGHGYLRFSSLYHPEDLARLAQLRKRLRLC